MTTVGVQTRSVSSLRVPALGRSSSGRSMGSADISSNQATHGSLGGRQSPEKVLAQSTPSSRPQSGRGARHYAPGVLTQGASAAALRAAQLSSSARKDTSPPRGRQARPVLSQVSSAAKSGASQVVGVPKRDQSQPTSIAKAGASLANANERRDSQLFNPLPSRPVKTPYLAAANKAWSASATKLVDSSGKSLAPPFVEVEALDYASSAWKHRSSEFLPALEMPPPLHTPAASPVRSRSANSEVLSAELRQFAVHGLNENTNGPLQAARLSFAHDRDTHQLEMELGMNTQPLTQHGFRVVQRPQSTAPSIAAIQHMHRELSTKLAIAPPSTMLNHNAFQRHNRSSSALGFAARDRRLQTSPAPAGTSGRVSMDETGARAALTAASLSFAEHPPPPPQPHPEPEPYQQVPHKLQFISLRTPAREDDAFKVKFLKKGRIRGIAPQERKRYERLWAANKGLLLVSPRGMSRSMSRGRSSAAIDASDASSDDDGDYLADTDPTAKDDVVNLVVRDIWLRSRLSADLLEQIYDLVDRGRRGRLSRDEFVVGTWLVDHCLRGRRLPTRRELTDDVFESGGPMARLGVKVPKRLKREEKKWLRPLSQTRARTGHADSGGDASGENDSSTTTKPPAPRTSNAPAQIANHVVGAVLDKAGLKKERKRRKAEEKEFKIRERERERQALKEAKLKLKQRRKSGIVHRPPHLEVEMPTTAPVALVATAPSAP